MSENELSCCGAKIISGTLWVLKDLKNFTKRKLYMSNCPKCGEDIIFLSETRISDNKTFFNVYKGLEAVKTIYRERKRKLTVIPVLQTETLFGWVYGQNIQIKNKKGKVIKLRQYSHSLRGSERTLTKEINM